MKDLQCLRKCIPGLVEVEVVAFTFKMISDALDPDFLTDDDCSIIL